MSPGTSLGILMDPPVARSAVLQTPQPVSGACITITTTGLKWATRDSRQMLLKGEDLELVGELEKLAENNLKHPSYPKVCESHTPRLCFQPALS